MKNLRIVIAGVFPLFIFPLSVEAQQVPDTSFSYPIHQPAYQKGQGPVIYIDQAHNNFHTREGGFSPFAKLLEGDGYRLNGYEGKGIRASVRPD